VYVMRSPLGRLLSFVFSLVILAIVYFAVIRPQLDKATNAINSGNRQTEAKDIDSDSLYSSDNFAKVYDQIKSKTGSDAQLLETRISPGNMEVQVRNGEKASGLSYNISDKQLVPQQVDLVGPGTLEGSSYPISKLRPDAPGRVAAAVRAKLGGDAHVTNMTLKKDGVTQGKLKWVVNADAQGRTSLVYYVSPNGTKVTGSPGTTAPIPGASSVPSTGIPDTQKYTKCVTAAGGDPTKIQRCTALLH
jgi:hypothetical protein